MQINSLTKQHAGDVALLHIEGISAGFISSLGVGFVTALYESITEDENSFGFVAIENGKVLGFVAFTSNLSKLYKYVISKKGLKFSFILAKKMMSIRTIKKIFANLFYPKKMKEMELPDAELLSIVVAQQGRGKGLASQLTQAGFDECQKRGLDKVKVLVAAENQAANKLYQKCGFKFATKIDSHGVVSNIYTAVIRRK